MLISLECNIRSRKTAKVALNEGRSEHPTKGKGHDESTRLKISESQGKVWDSLDDSERQKRSEIESRAGIKRVKLRSVKS